MAQITIRDNVNYVDNNANKNASLPNAANLSSMVSADTTAKHDDSATESYFWIMIGALMLFVLAFLMLLKKVRKARLAAYPEIISGFTGRYQRNPQRQLID